MKKKIVSIFIVLCIMLSLLPTTSISAETTSYTTGLFASKFSNNQIFDIMGDNRLNGLSFDSSWGFSGSSWGHQFRPEHLANRYFTFKYSGDSTYPVALFLYNNDNTPVVSNKAVDASDNLYDDSLIGCNENGCLTPEGKTYMNSTYGGISGLVAQGTVDKMDENGFLFRSKNGFGYYISGNRGYNGNETITWINPDISVTIDDLANITTYSDVPLISGQYAVMFNANTKDSVINMPQTQIKTNDTELQLSSETPVRPGYKFKHWNTKADGSGTSYSIGVGYTANASMTLYSIWEQELTSYTITYTAGVGGTITGMQTQTVNHGGDGTFVTATPNPGYHFVSWSDGVMTVSRIDANVTGNIAVTAIFAANTPTTYTITFDANSGSVSPISTATNGEYKLATLPIPTRSGSYSFRGWFTQASGGTQVTTDTVFTKNTTIYAHWIYTGGGSSSGGSTSGNTPNISKDEEIKVNGEVNGTIDSNGNAKVTITDDSINDAYNKALDNAKKNGTDEENLSITLNIGINNKAVNSITVNLPKIIQNTIMSKNIVNTIMVADNPDIKISIDLSTIKEINKQANSDVNITAKKVDNNTLSAEAKKVVGSRPVFDFTIIGTNGKKVTNFGNGKISVSIPYTLSANEKAENIVAYYIDDNGKVHEMSNCVYDKKIKTISFTTNHFSKYAVGHKEEKPNPQKNPKTGDTNAENLKIAVYSMMCAAILFSIAKKKLLDK